MRLGILIPLLLLLSSVSSELSPKQKYTMLKLSDLLHNQTSSIYWDVGTDPCLWKGVTCSSNVTGTTNSTITELSMSNIGLSDASFLPLACQIPTLEVLDVSKNLVSSIPKEFFTSCGEIQGLKLVNFSCNRVSGPLPSFSDGFTALETLDLAHNVLTGSIGAQFSGLVSLRSLNFSFNDLTGLLPASLGKFRSLEQLQLSGNKLQGTIPDQFADYKNLTFLDLSSNYFSGTLSSSFGELSRLEVLVLSANFLSGKVPDIISRIITLQRFAANQNNFSGDIPPGISNFVKTLDLSYNNLRGSIPYDLLSPPQLQAVDLSYNGLIGTIPANVSSNLVRLRLAGNSLNGSISSIKFRELQNLAYLELEDNSLTGTIPSELGSCQQLQLLNLAGNRFSGELPTELGDLKQLTVLSLQRNNFAGKIPDKINQLTNLLTLNISWNSLNGSIPPVSGLTKLAYLHLQGNHLSGLIPLSISNLNSLIDLQLGMNQLSSPIVSMPRNLQYALNLSNNLFQGPIPKSLGEAVFLEVLDLSNNRFSGKIPEFLTDLRSITLLLLDNNNLSGVLPNFGPNVVVDTKGNPGLVRVSPWTTPVSTHKKKSFAVKIVAVVGAVLFGALVATLAVFLSRRLLYRVRDLEDHPKDEDTPLPKVIESLMLTTSSIHKSNIDFTKAMEAVANPLNLLLKTKFSTYYKVLMPSGRCYFVKKVNCTDRICQPNSCGNFGKNLEALGKLNSSNIMTPLAYTLTADSAYLYYEMASKGTLFDVLHRNSDIPLDWVSRCSIAVGIAQGLTSLHGCSSGPILLFDLASKTVMLKSVKEPQIGDIELCKVIDPLKSNSSLSAVAGSVGYIPPEYAYTMRVTLAGNVYSFGVILLELLTGRQAVSEGTELAKWVWSNSAQPQKWDRILDSSVSRSSPAAKTQMLAFLKVALACINASSEARPKIKSVLRMLLNAR